MRVPLILCFVISLVAGCSTSMQETRYDSKTGVTSTTKYAPYFQTRTLLVSDKIGLDLIVDVEKKVMPGLYQLQQSLGALGPGDLNATGLFTAYVTNLTNEPLSLNVSAMTHQRQSVPGLPVVVNLMPNAYKKIVLGRIGVFSYATKLEVEIVYCAGSETVTRTLKLRRLTPEDIEREISAWKGHNITKSPAFFPD
jgi:hypothetical protein